ncbi:anaerobic ribonucleoside-triphosphate reductase [Cupriavidus necator]
MNTDLHQPATTVLDPALRTRCEVWTRVMGYHRPVSSFNTGKQGEFHERRFFTESPSR